MDWEAMCIFGHQQIILAQRALHCIGGSIIQMTCQVVLIMGKQTGAMSGTSKMTKLLAIPVLNGLI